MISYPTRFIKPVISYEQMMIGLDNLFFKGKLENDLQVYERLEVIDAYVEACGWSWELILDHIDNNW